MSIPHTMFADLYALTSLSQARSSCRLHHRPLPLTLDSTSLMPDSDSPILTYLVILAPNHIPLISNGLVNGLSLSVMVDREEGKGRVETLIPNDLANWQRLIDFNQSRWIIHGNREKNSMPNMKIGGKNRALRGFNF